MDCEPSRDATEAVCDDPIRGMLSKIRGKPINDAIEAQAYAWVAEQRRASRIPMQSPQQWAEHMRSDGKAMNKLDESVVHVIQSTKRLSSPVSPDRL